MPRHSPNLPPTARAIAFEILADRQSAAFASDRLDAACAQAPARERSLATELTLGTIRRQATLDALIAPHVNRPRHRVEEGLWTLMRLGTYQLTFLAGMADHAAVHETVALAKKINPRWSGILNAVLRKVAASLTDAVLTMPTADGVPLADGRFRLLTTRLFPEPDDHPADYFAQAFSFPRWLAVRWAKRFPPAELFAIGQYFNRPPRPTLRVNTHRTTREDLLQRFQQAGIPAKPGEHPSAIHLERHGPVTEWPGFHEGHFTIQDETAMCAASRLDPQPGMRVLDLCAAPGTKTTHLAELMDNRGAILATDIHADRLARVQENAGRLGFTNIETRLITSGETFTSPDKFDAILLDVPCSNTGVLGKRPEARWRLQPDDVRELAAKQTALLSNALTLVKPGGRILYSTCSIEPEENEQVVQQALASHSHVQVLESRLFIPGASGDGGFQALIEMTDRV